MFRAAVISLVLAVALRSQSDRPAGFERPVEISLATAGIVAVHSTASVPDRIVALDFPTAAGEALSRLPFATPVREVAVGRFADGRYVVLAGGVQDGLDLYHFDPTTPTMERHPTDGGHRLSSSFAGGLGSWPANGGGGLLVFAFEREDHIHFRAVMPAGSIARQVLPLDCSGFEATLDPRSREVRVVFSGPAGGEIADLHFQHPIAPLLALSGAAEGVLDFGQVPLGTRVIRRVLIRNEGPMRFDGRMAIDAPFELDGRGGTLVLEPRAEVELPIAWVAAAPGEALGQLRITSAVKATDLTLELLGRAAVAAVASQPAPLSGSTAPRPAAPPGDPGSDGPEALPTVPPPRLAGAERAATTVGWVARAAARVDIRLSEEDREVDSIALRNAASGRPKIVRVDDGLARTVLSARALDPIQIAAVGPDGEPGPWTTVATVPPALRLEYGWIAVHAPAASQFLLMEVLLGEDRAPRRVLRTWRGRADAQGHARFDVGTLVGETECYVHLVLAVQGDHGATVTSRPFEIGPSAPR